MYSNSVVPEEWLNFHLAAEEIAQRCDVSVGVAQRMLREACAQGDIRSQREPYSRKGQEIEGEGPPELIKPSEWLRDQVDLTTDADGCEYFVDVNEDDFRYWLDRQTTNTTDNKSTRPRRDHVSRIITELWPGEIPKELVNKAVVKLVRDKLAKDCEQKNLPLLAVSDDTILRAAGRK
jgi:hypothetical protein